MDSPKKPERRPVYLAIAAAGAIVVAILAFGVFGIQTLFIDDKVDEAAPVFASGAGASGFESDAISEDVADDMNEFMEDEQVPTEVTVDEATAMPDDGPAEIVTVAEGSFIDRSHPTSGVATVLTDGSAQRFLRFEDFETDNGPDLNVWLTKTDADASTGDIAASSDNYVDLGDLKGNIGAQNYEIPEDVNLDEFDTVVIWCVRFGVAFGAADIVASS